MQFSPGKVNINWNLNKSIISVKYLHNSMCAYLMDCNSMSFLNDLSRTNGLFDNRDAFGIMLTHCTQIL